MQRLFILVFLICGIAISGMAQSSKKAQAQALFKNGKYADVISVLSGEKRLLRQDAESNFLLAVSYYQTNQLDASLDLLDRLIGNEKNVYPECWWFRGKVLHAQNKFDAAAFSYKNYLVNLKDNDPKRQMVIDAIRNCSNGMKYLYKPGLAEVDNLGPEVNTVYDEFAPVVSPNFSNKLYFSAVRPENMGAMRNESGQIDEIKGEKLSDIYLSEMTGGRWENVQSMGYLINSAANDVLLDFGIEGQTLLLFKGWTMNEGQILVDTFKQEDQRSVTTAPFISPINANSGDGMLFFANDTLVLFASNTLDGYGGYDLYKVAVHNNYWGEPINLGPDINTNYDEITPFLALDGRTLYYSSNNSYKSIGGFDILKSTYIPELDRWLEPKNLKVPINSANDDTHFRLNTDGTTAFFCSSRRDGYGKRDLYIAYFKKYLAEMEPPAQAPVKVSGQQFPGKEQELSSLPQKQRDEENFQTSAQNIALAPEGEAAQHEKPEALGLSSVIPYTWETEVFDEGNFSIIQNKMAHLKTNPDSRLILTVETDTEKGLFDAIQLGEETGILFFNEGIPRKNVFIKAIPNGKEKRLHLDILQDPSLQPRGMVHPVNAPLCYKVQIVSVQKAYGGALLDAYEWPMIEKSFNGQYYRYTLGAFDRFAEAKNLRDEVRRKGAPDAYIVPYIHGFRMNSLEVRNYAAVYPDLKAYLADK